MKIEYMSVDLETFSSIDINRCSVYKYAESPDAELLLFACSVNGGPVTVYDVANGSEIPEEILAALSDESVTKWAYNAAFERVFLSVWLKRNHSQHFSSYSIDGDTVRDYLAPSSSGVPWSGRHTWGFLSPWKEPGLSLGWKTRR